MNDNHIGETVGIFKIVELMPYKHKDGHAMYKAICAHCGFERVSKYSDLKETSKCTHIRIDGNIATIHKPKWQNKRIKNIFNGMKRRCYNQNDKGYKWYGAKGIKVCDEWINNPSSFEEWSLQNGYNDTLTIDRIDENKDYSSHNCRWIPDVQNTKYKSTTSLINVNGEEHTGRDWSRILGLSINTINKYIRRYGLENTIIFIDKFLKNPNLKPKVNQSYYDLYMNKENAIAV